MRKELTAASLHLIQDSLQSDRTSFKTEEHKKMQCSYESIDVTMVIVWQRPHHAGEI